MENEAKKIRYTGYTESLDRCGLKRSIIFFLGGGGETAFFGEWEGSNFNFFAVQNFFMEGSKKTFLGSVQFFFFFFFFGGSILFVFFCIVDYALKLTIIIIIIYSESGKI